MFCLQFGFLQLMKKPQCLCEYLVIQFLYNPTIIFIMILLCAGKPRTAHNYLEPTYVLYIFIPFNPIYYTHSVLFYK